MQNIDPSIFDGAEHLIADTRALLDDSAYENETHLAKALNLLQEWLDHATET